MSRKCLKTSVQVRDAPSAFAPLRYNPDTIKAWAGDSQWRAYRADWARFRTNGFTAWGSEGFWALALHRLQKAIRKQHPEWLWAPLLLVLCIVRKLFAIITLIDIHPDAEIGPGLIIPHGGPIRVLEIPGSVPTVLFITYAQLEQGLDQAERRSAIMSLSAVIPVSSAQ